MVQFPQQLYYSVVKMGVVRCLRKNTVSSANNNNTRK